MEIYEMSESTEESCLTFYTVAVCFTDEVSITAETNDRVWAMGEQLNAPWHLHQISHVSHNATEYTYVYPEPQASTKVYVMDGWMDTEHPEFEGRACRGPAFESGLFGDHGTHVGSLVAGKTVGVNRQAHLVSVQILNGGGSGAWSSILKGLEWVKQQGTDGSAVINLSIAGSKSLAVNRVINDMVNHGWKIVVAAGNERSNACSSSPASAEKALTVAAATVEDRLASFSNYGKCTNIVSPGLGILGAYPGRKYAYMSGTSMAAPLVAGVWSTHPEWSYEDLLLNTLPDRMIGRMPSSTPNRYVYAPQTPRLLFPKNDAAYSV